MIKIKRKIPNPMTIIAIFAVLSESSAAISLPFLEDEEREIYVWFLISFPFYLLFLFFITLNFNYRSLYAPSDFEKDESFLHVIDNNARDSRAHESSEDISNKVSSKSVPATGETPNNNETRRMSNTSDPPKPVHELLDSIAQHHISLAEAVNELHIIDTRAMTEQSELAASLDRIPTPGKRSSQLVVFLSNGLSNGLLTTDKLRQCKPPKKIRGTTHFIVYKVCTQTMTVLGKF